MSEFIVIHGAYLKFTSPGSEAFRQLLLGTGDKTIMETNPTDRIWGIGMSKAVAVESIQDQSAWGSNLLGKVLMAV